MTCTEEIGSSLKNDQSHNGGFHQLYGGQIVKFEILIVKSLIKFHIVSRNRFQKNNSITF